VDGESSFHLVNLGGASPGAAVLVKAEPDAELEHYWTTERTAAARIVSDSIVEHAYRKLRRDRKARARFYFGADPAAYHGAAYQLYAGFLTAKEALAAHGVADVGRRVVRAPCPTSESTLVLAKAAHTYNQCVAVMLKGWGMTVEEAERATRGRRFRRARSARKRCDYENVTKSLETFCSWDHFGLQVRRAAAARARAGGALPPAASPAAGAGS